MRKRTRHENQTRLILIFLSFSDSYVKLSLVRGSKILATEKTKVIKKNLEPQFEQEFKFTVMEDLLDEVNLIIRVKHKPLIGRKRLLGELCIGCQGAGQGLAQWQLMMDKEVVMWHQLELLNIVPGKTHLQTTMATLQGWETTSEEERRARRRRARRRRECSQDFYPGGYFLPTVNPLKRNQKNRNCQQNSQNYDACLCMSIRNL